MSDGEHYGPEHRLERLIFFSDAVFAIAITLLIIEVHVPHLHADATNADWLDAMRDVLPGVAGFGLSFLVIGAMWARHHAIFAMLTRYAPTLMWPNLLFLMSVAFLPFSTGLLSLQAQPSPVPYACYAASLLAAALLKTRLTYVALRPDLVAHGVTAAAIAVERRRCWIMPIAAGMSLVLAFVLPGWNTIAMLLIAVLRRLPYFKEKQPAAPGRTENETT